MPLSKKDEGLLRKYFEEFLTYLRNNKKVERIETSVDFIKRSVAEHYDIPLTYLDSKRKDEQYYIPRWIAIYYVKKLLGVPPHLHFPVTRNACYYVIEQLKIRMVENENFKYEVQLLEKAIQNKLLNHKYGTNTTDTDTTTTE